MPNCIIGLLILLSLAWPASAFALPLAYNLTLHADSGPAFIGGFTIDDVLLSHEGDNLRGTIADFHIAIGASRFDQQGGDDGFSGFRGPYTSDDEESGAFFIGAAAPGFIVHDGVLTGLQGGVYSGGDLTYIDFFLDHHFNAAFFATPSFPETDISYVSGSFCVSPLTAPEPATITYLAAGLLGLWWWKRGRHTHGGART
jgi:hypothetical protein